MAKSASQPAFPFRDPVPSARTPLGKRLWQIRQRVVESEEPLLGWSDLEREIAERRGEKVGP